MVLRLILINVGLALSRLWFPIHYGDELVYRWDIGDSAIFFILMSLWSLGLMQLHQRRKAYFDAALFLALGFWPPLRFLGLALYLIQMMRWYRYDRGLSEVARVSLIVIQALVFSALLW